MTTHLPLIFCYFCTASPFRGKWDQDQRREHETDSVEQVRDAKLTCHTLRDKGRAPHDGDHEEEEICFEAHRKVKLRFNV